MAIELTAAYVSIIPETSRIAPRIREAMTGVGQDADKAGQTMGSKLTAGIGKVMKVGAVATGAAVAGVMGTAMVKGFSRSNALDQAQAKLRGLKLEAGDVTRVMEGVSKSVTGTAFGLDQAATSAAKLASANVAVGAEMDRALKLTADIAAQAGTSMDDVSSIMAKITGAGKLTGETLAQLDDRAVGAAGALSKHLGVSIEEVREQISAGKIDVETFQVAMEEHLGGAALKTGETFQGAFDNMMAALGRFGEKLIEPAFTAGPAIFSSLGGAVDAMSSAMGPALERISGALGPAFERLAGLIETRLTPALALGAEKIGDLAARLIEAAVDPVMWERVGGTMSTIATAASAAWPAVSSLAESFGRIAAAISVQVWQALGDVLQALVPVIEHVLVPVLTQVADLAEQHPGLVQGMVYAWLGMKGISAVAGPVKSTVGIVKNLGEAASTTSTLIRAGGLVEGVSELGKYAGSANPVLASLGGGVGKVGGAFGKFGKVLGPIGKALGPVVGFVARLAPLFLKLIPAVGIIAGIGTALWAFFTKTEIGRKMWDGLVSALQAAWAWIKDVFAGVWDTVSEKFSAAWEAIKGAFSTAIGFISDHWQTLLTIFGGPLGAAISAVSTHWDTIKNAAGVAFDWIRDKWEMFTTGFGQFFETWVRPVIDAFSTGWTMASQGVSLALDWISQKWGEFSTAISQFWQTYISPVLTLMQAGWSVVSSAIGVAINSVILPAWNLLSSAIRTVWSSVISVVWEAIKTGASVLGAVLSGIFNGVIRPAFELLGTAISSVWNNIIRPVWDFFASAAGLLADVLTGNFSNIRNRFSEMGEALGRIVRGPINVAMDVFKGIVRAVGQAWEAFRDTVSRVVGIVRDKITEMVDRIREIPGKVKDFFSSAGTWLVQAGKDIISGLIDGVMSMAGRIGDAISSIMPAGIGAIFSDGGITAYAAGGIAQTEAYANGGHRREHHAPQIARAGRGVRIWAEPETKGEAYIPLANDHRRPRAQAILARTAQLLGLSVTHPDGSPFSPGYRGGLGPTAVQQFADGGITSPYNAQQFSAFVRGGSVDGQSNYGKSLQGSTYDWGGPKWRGSWGDCTGAMSIIAGFARSMWKAGQVVRRLFYTGDMASVLPKMGFRRGAGPAGSLRIAGYNGGAGGGHAWGTLPDGTNVEMRGGGAGGLIGGSAWGADSAKAQMRFWMPVAGSRPEYKSGTSSDSTAGMTVPSAGASGGSSGGGSAAATPAVQWGSAQELWNQASRYLGVIDGLKVPTPAAVDASSTPGSDTGGLGVATEPAGPSWGPAFFNREIARAAKAKNLPIRGAMIGIGTTLVESGDPQKMYANRGVPKSLEFRHDALGSDHDSVGLFQQRQAGWGTLAQRMNPFESAGLFFSAMLRKFPGWAGMDPGAVAQGVQVSAFPAKYAPKMPKALELAKATRLYDQGGVLPHLGMSLNLSRRPEAILTNRQWGGFFDLTRSTGDLVVAVAAMLDPMRVLARDGRDTARHTGRMAQEMAEQATAEVGAVGARASAAVWQAVPAEIKDALAAAEVAGQHWQTVSVELGRKATAWARGEWPIGSGRVASGPGPAWEQASLDRSLQEVAAANVALARAVIAGDASPGSDPLANAIFDVFGRAPLLPDLERLITADSGTQAAALAAIVETFETGDTARLQQFTAATSQMTELVLRAREATMGAGQWVKSTIIDPLEYVTSGRMAADAWNALQQWGEDVRATMDQMSAEVAAFGFTFGGEWLSQVEIVRDAELGLAQTREQVATELAALAEAEVDTDQAREISENAARKIAAAERVVAAARFQAAGQIATDLTKAWGKSATAVGQFFTELDKMADIVAKTRQEVAKLGIEQVTTRIAAVSAAHDLRIAELDLERTRHKSMVEVAKAQAALAKAQRGQLTMTDASVSNLAWAVDRFRVAGVAAVDDIALSYVVNAAAVAEAEWALEMARADQAIAQHEATFKQTQAAWALQQATALQVHTAEVAQMVTLQLAQQTEALHGMTMQQGGALGRFAQGATGAMGGIGGLLGSIATGLASFATGNWLGVAGAVVGGIQSLGQLVVGGNKMKQNAPEAKEAWKNLDGGTKLGFGLSLLGGGLAMGAGVAGSLAGFGPDALIMGGNIGSAIVETGLGSITQIWSDNLEAVNARNEALIDAVKQQYELDKAMSGAWWAGEQARNQVERAALEATRDAAAAQRELAKAELDGEDPVVIEALRALAAEAVSRRDELNGLLEADRSALEAAVEALRDKSQGTTPGAGAGSGSGSGSGAVWVPGYGAVAPAPTVKQITIELGDGHAYSGDQVEELITALDGQISGVDLRVSRLERAGRGALDYILAKNR